MSKKLSACIFIAAICVFACKRKSYVEHELKFEKVAEGCTDQQSYFRMTSNFGGERYEFEKCLPADFKKDQLVTERRGDTIFIKFKNEPQTGGMVFHLTLDIDSYPRYKFLMIDNDMYSITTPDNN